MKTYILNNGDTYARNKQCEQDLQVYMYALPTSNVTSSIPADAFGFKYKSKRFTQNYHSRKQNTLVHSSL